MRAPFLLAGLLLAGGCGFLSDPPELQEFLFIESTHGEAVDATVDAAGIGDGIGFVGQLNTPTPCHRLRGEFDHTGSRLTLHVIARRTTDSCEDILGNFRYEGAIRKLDFGTYQLRIVHSFEGSTWEPQEFNLPVTVR
jgi:hypothetical protein